MVVYKNGSTLYIIEEGSTRKIRVPISKSSYDIQDISLVIHNHISGNSYQDDVTNIRDGRGSLFMTLFDLEDYLDNEVSIGNFNSASGGSGANLVRTIVPISSSDLLSIGTTPIELIPNSIIPDGSLIIYREIIIYNEHGTTGYTMPVGDTLIVANKGGRVIGACENVFFTTANKEIITFSQNNETDSESTLTGFTEYRPNALTNQGLELKTYNGGNLTTGDRTGHAIISYEILELPATSGGLGIGSGSPG